MLLSASVPFLPGLQGAAMAASTQNSCRLSDGWEYSRGNLGGVWEVWRGDKASDNVPWTAVKMPHCFNAFDAVDPDTPYYQGPGWYRTLLKVENPYPNGRVILHFEGAGQKTEVFVGLTKAGAHVGGYDEFAVDITEAVARSQQLSVCCDNTRDLEMIPSSLSDFNLYGGLYRHVNLVYLPAISLGRVHIHSTVQPGGNTAVSVKARLFNPRGLKDEVEIGIQLLDPSGKVIHAAARKITPGASELELTAFAIEKGILWSPAKPALYRCEVTLKSPHGETKTSERFGLRYFEWVKHGPFKLNGERLLLKGTHRHEDHAGLAAGLTDEVIRKEMQMIKDVGANFIRLGHYQQSRLALDLCDELGFLVWEEIPWCRGGIGGARYKQQARDMLRALIDQHRNHPSIILWGLGNENDWPGDFPEFDKARIQAFMSELNKLAHQLDPSRKTCIRRCDFCKDIVDVYSPSIWAGWYRGQYTEYKSSTEKEVKGVNHFFHAEWGGDSHARRHSEDPDAGLTKIATGQGTDERGLDYLLTGGNSRASKDGDWSETYICNLFDWHLKEMETMPYLTGAAQWIFKDFSTPLRPENPVPRMNQKGIVERDLTPKESYYVFQSFWAEKPMVRLYGHSWPVRWGEQDQQKLVKVYSNCETAELYLNGVSIGVKKRNSQDFPAAGLRWLVRFKAGENKLRVVAKQHGVEVTDEITQSYETRKWSKPAKVELKELARAGGKVTVEASLSDANGVRCLDSRARVRFGVTGDGRLLENLGTSTGSRVVEVYNGRACIQLECKGTAVVSVTSKSVRTAILKIETS